MITTDQIKQLKTTLTITPKSYHKQIIKQQLNTLAPNNDQKGCLVVNKNNMMSFEQRVADIMFVWGYIGKFADGAIDCGILKR